MSPQLDAFGVVVRDMPRALTFYRALGLEFPEGSENEGHVEAQLANGVRYMLDTEDLIESFDSEWKRPDGHVHGGAFRCESPEEVDSVYAALLAAGGHAHREPWDAFWGQRYAQVSDPDGTVVDLYAPLPEQS